MESKSDLVRCLVKNKRYKDALRLAKDFRRGISREDSDRMKRGYECLVHPKFYLGIGEDPDQLAALGIETVIRLYG